jgi:hypothetical protein
MERMSLTRALLEKKRLEKRIEKTIKESEFIDYKIGINGKPRYDVDIVANFQSVTDLMQRRDKIVAKLAEANATATITVGTVVMTIAEAIARKNSIHLEKLLLKKLKSNLTELNAEKEDNEEEMEEKFAELSKSMYGKEKVSEVEIKEAYKSFEKRNGLIVIDSLNLQETIKIVEDRIEDFELNVDVALSEANGKIEIEI